MIETRIVEVDAELAAEFLSNEKAPEVGVKGTNRKASAAIVAEYAAAMLRPGEWKLNHQGIAFDEEGTLIDGGHRLRAVIKASETRPDLKVKFFVSFGVPADSVSTMDIGKRRLPSDFLTMHGEVNATSLSGVLRAAYCYFHVPWNGVESWTRYRLTPQPQMEFLDKNPLLRDAVYEGFALKRILKQSAGGAFWFLAKTIRPDVDVQDFVVGLRSGANLEKGNPILTLRELLLNARDARRMYEVPEELALTIKAFNRWMAGGRYESLAFRYDEQFPRIAPA